MGIDDLAEKIAIETDSKESLTWTNMKLSPAGWTNDTDLFTGVDINLDTDYVWTAGPNVLGGNLSFESESSILNRTASTASAWGSWN